MFGSPNQSVIRSAGSTGTGLAPTVSANSQAVQPALLSFLNGLGEAYNRARRIADLIAGPVPPHPQSSNNPEPTDASLLALMQQANACVNAIHDELTRSEKALGL